MKIKIRDEIKEASEVIQNFNRPLSGSLRPTVAQYLAAKVKIWKYKIFYQHNPNGKISSRERKRRITRKHKRKIQCNQRKMNRS